MENQRWEMEFTESWRHGTRCRSRTKRGLSRCDAMRGRSRSRHTTRRRASHGTSQTTVLRVRLRLCRVEAGNVAYPVRHIPEHVMKSKRIGVLAADRVTLSTTVAFALWRLRVLRQQMVGPTPSDIRESLARWVCAPGRHGCSHSASIGRRKPAFLKGLRSRPTRHDLHDTPSPSH